MKQSRNNRWVLAAAVAASLMSVPAMAQIRAGQDGHASDSSNRVGSGGYNSGGYIYNNGVNPNQVIYGNVTGGQWFHGPGERDPRQFTGPSGATIGDEFIRGTSGVPTAYQPATPQYSPQPFYGAGRQVAPPTGTERLGYTGSFVGTGTAPVGGYNLFNNIAAASDVLRQSPGQDTPIGVRHGLLDSQGDLTQLPPNQAILDASSPLYGLQGLPGQPGSENGELSTFAPPSLAPGGTDRFRMQQSEIERLRNELQSTPMDQGTQQNGANGNAKGGPNQNAAQQNGTLSTSSSLNNAAEQPNGSNLNGQQQQTNTPALNSGTLNNGNTPQGQQQRSTLVQPRVPGGQANVLRDRFDQYLTPQMRVLRANAQNLNLLSRIKSKANAPGEHGATTQPAGAGAVDTSIGAEGAGAQGYISTTPIPGAAAGNGGGNVAGQPVKITSLADGVSAKGLHDLLKSAEDLMRQDKFESAIEKYKAAEQVAPRDTLIALGRANADLGAGFYHRASTELHNVFGIDPALLMGQYDLKSWFSPRRLQFITKELSDLAASDPKSEDPVFLLAYISYNTGDTAKAADYLKQARTRSGGSDYLLDQLESRWKLSGPSVPASGLNK